MKSYGRKTFTLIFSNNRGSARQTTYKVQERALAAKAKAKEKKKAEEEIWKDQE